MKYTHQNRFYPDTKQKLMLNSWLRICRYWYNRQVGDRFDWWEHNRTYINACPIQHSVAEPREKPSRYGQQALLPALKTDLVKVIHSGELLDFSSVDATVLQDVCKRADDAFKRFIASDKNGKRSGRPRFKNQASYKTMVFAMVKPSWIKLVRKRWMYIRLPKIGIVKVRMHRPVPKGAVLKRISVSRKADGWYINLCLEDTTVPEQPITVTEPTWDNSIGIDAVLKGSDFLALSDGTKEPSAKPLRTSQPKLAAISTKKNARKRGSRSRRKLAKREARQHQVIARQRKDHRYKTAHAVVRRGADYIFVEKLNLKGLSKRNKAKQNADGTYAPNGQSAKSGLNKSWNDAAFGAFFETLEYIAEKAGSTLVKQKPAYSSRVLSYRNEDIFTDLDIREFNDPIENVTIDRDVNAAINLKRLGLGIFPSIKRRKGSIAISGDMDDSTTKEILAIFRDAKKPTLYR